MWLLNALPYWVFYSIFSMSLIMVVGASVINLRSVQIVGSLLLLVSTWFIGGIENDRAWQARVKDMEARVVLAEAASAKVNTEIVTKTITKIKLVKDTTNANVQYITKYVTQELDNKCSLTAASILLHNSASQNEVPGSSSIAASGPSNVKASELLSTVVENYGTYYEVTERLKAWQDWYWQQKQVFEELK